MAELYNLKVHFNLLQDKIKNKLQVQKYTLKVNNYLKKVLIKLKAMGVVKDLVIKKHLVTFRPDNYRSIELYHRPTEVLNSKNYRKIVKQKLKDNLYNTLLISTSKGLKTLRESITENVGGYVIGVINSKRPIYNC